MLNKELNILVTSAGRRNNLINYFKKELAGRGKVYAGDMNSLAAAAHFADGFIQTPSCYDPSYFDCMKNICKEKNITGIISLTDTELTELSKHSREFSEMGITIVGSPYETTERCFDKLFLYRFCETHGYYTPKTFLGYDSFKAAYDKGDIDFPVYIKPRTGSASVDNCVANSMDEVILCCILRDDLLIQEMLVGTELGIDIYIDLLSNEVVSVFVKDKISMRSGETDKAVSSKHPGLFDLIKEFSSKMLIRGVVDIDIVMIGSKYYIIDVNPRFGGGYPLAYNCGCDFPKYLINNLYGNENIPSIGEYEEGVYMLKCEGLVIKKDILNHS